MTNKKRVLTEKEKRQRLIARTEKRTAKKILSSIADDYCGNPNYCKNYAWFDSMARIYGVKELRWDSLRSYQSKNNRRN